MFQCPCEATSLPCAGGSAGWGLVQGGGAGNCARKTLNCCRRPWDASAVPPPCAVKSIVPLMFLSLGTASECTAQLVQQLKTINPPESLLGEACFYLFGKLFINHTDVSSLTATEPDK